MDDARNDIIQELISQVQNLIDDMNEIEELERDLSESLELAHQLKDELETLLEDE